MSDEETLEKEEIFVFPGIDIYSRAEEKSRLILNESKLESVTDTYKELQERGYKIYILNLIHPEDSMGFNPLTILSKRKKKEDKKDVSR